MKNKMIEQLEELLEMQKALDNAFMKSNGLTYDDTIANNMRVALIVEVGELMNEFPTKFKHWKKTAVDNREKGLVEFIDCLHFVLSLINYEKSQVQLMEYENYTDILKGEDTLLHTLSELVDDLYTGKVKLMFLFDLGNYLGFTWEEIYNAYKDKNAINYERIKNGY